jgi:hypothetical protein
MKRTTIALLVLVCGVLTGVYCSRPSWRALDAQKKEFRAQVSEARHIQAERTELLKETSRLESPFGKEQRARELGYRKPYEKPLTID